ncbi:MAG: hypothetical protein LBJ59_08700 [Zoogloeaceae bacterium]|jgi:hypothetical protein|nr:hypothetical protein [Zoogloeaceae bacterium]
MTTDKELAPFAVGKYDGVQVYTMDAAGRIRLVKTFDAAQCEAALKVPYLQKAVARALLARLKRIEREAES